MSARIYLNSDSLTVVNPTGLNYQSDGTNPDAQELTIFNEQEDNADVSFTASSNEDWLFFGVQSAAVTIANCWLTNDNGGTPGNPIVSPVIVTTLTPHGAIVGQTIQIVGNDELTNGLHVVTDVPSSIEIKFEMLMEENVTIGGGTLYRYTDQSSGVFSHTVPYVLDANVNVTGLADGTYTDTITITTAFGDTEVPVVLVVSS